MALADSEITCIGQKRGRDYNQLVSWLNGTNGEQSRAKYDYKRKKVKEDSEA
jgi:hypothetical protein